MVYITISTGIGCGIIIDGRIFRGSRGYAGEAGHICMDMHSGAVCGCGNKGCAEAMASGSSFDASVKALMEKGIKTCLTLPISGEKLKEAAEAGDDAAIAVLKDSAKTVGVLLYNINCILDVDRFVLGGGLMNLGEGYLEDIKASFAEYSKVKIDIVPAALKDNIGTVGAAQLLLN